MKGGAAAVNTFQLSCFAEVAATLNFSQAARNLGVSQPAVSHQVKALETELGCSLVSRSTRTVSLTDEGMQFLSYANDILDLAARGARIVSRSHESTTKTLRIGAHGGLEAIAVAPALRALCTATPDLVPDVRVGPHSALVNMLEGGTLDAVLEYRDPSGVPAAATVFRRVAETPPACLCSSDHPLAGGGRISLADLREAGRIALCNPYASSAAIDSLQRRVIMQVDVDNVFMCSGVESAVALAAAGVAVAVLPNVPELRFPGLCAMEIGDLPSIVFGVRVRRGRMAPALAALLRALSEHAHPDGAGGGGASAPASAPR